MSFPGLPGCAVPPSVTASSPSEASAPANSRMHALQKLLVDNGARTDEQLFQALAAWGNHDEPDKLAQEHSPVELDAVSLARLSGLLATACESSAWHSALMVASVLGEVVTAHAGLAEKMLQPIKCQLSGGKPPVVALQASLLFAIESFGEAVEKKPQWAHTDSAADADTKQPSSDVDIIRLSTALGTICNVLQTALLPHLGKGLADVLLQTPFLVKALLCVTATAPEAPAGPDTKVVQFSMLQTRRLTGELLAALLEEASAEQRLHFERELVFANFEPGASRLVETLVLAHPDPKLHDLLLELLWRGLRRLEVANDELPGVSPSLRLLRELAGELPCQKLRAITAEELMDWGMDLALQLSKNGHEVVVLPACSLAWGGLQLDQCVATFSAHSFVIESSLSKTTDGSDEAEDGSSAQENPIVIEVPWMCVGKPRVAIEQGLPFLFDVDLEALCVLNIVPPHVEAAIGGSDSLFILRCTAQPEYVDSGIGELRRLFLIDSVPDSAEETADDSQTRADETAKVKATEAAEEAAKRAADDRAAAEKAVAEAAAKKAVEEDKAAVEKLATQKAAESAKKQAAKEEALQAAAEKAAVEAAVKKAAEEKAVSEATARAEAEHKAKSEAAAKKAAEGKAAAEKVAEEEAAKARLAADKAATDAAAKKAAEERAVYEAKVRKEAEQKAEAEAAARKAAEEKEAAEKVAKEEAAKARLAAEKAAAEAAAKKVAEERAAYEAKVRREAEEKAEAEAAARKAAEEKVAAEKVAKEEAAKAKAAAEKADAETAAQIAAEEKAAAGAVEAAGIREAEETAKNEVAAAKTKAEEKNVAEAATKKAPQEDVANNVAKQKAVEDASNRAEDETSAEAKAHMEAGETATAGAREINTAEENVTAQAVANKTADDKSASEVAAKKPAEAKDGLAAKLADLRSRLAAAHQAQREAAMAEEERKRREESVEAQRVEAERLARESARRECEAAKAKLTERFALEELKAQEENKSWGSPRLSGQPWNSATGKAGDMRDSSGVADGVPDVLHQDKKSPEMEVQAAVLHSGEECQAAAESRIDSHLQAKENDDKPMDQVDSDAKNNETTVNKFPQEEEDTYNALESHKHQPEEQEFPVMELSKYPSHIEGELQSSEEPMADMVMEEAENDGKSPEPEEAAIEDNLDELRAISAVGTAVADCILEVADAAEVSKSAEATNASGPAQTGEVAEAGEAVLLEAGDVAQANQPKEMSAAARASMGMETPEPELSEAALESESCEEHDSRKLEPEESESKVNETVSAHAVQQTNGHGYTSEMAKGVDVMMQSHADEPQEQQLVEMQAKQSGTCVEGVFQACQDSMRGHALRIIERDGKCSQSAAMENNLNVGQASESAQAAVAIKTVAASNPIEALDVANTSIAAKAAETAEACQAGKVDNEADIIEADDVAQATKPSEASAIAGASNVSQALDAELSEAAKESVTCKEHDDNVLESDRLDAQIDEKDSVDAYQQAEGDCHMSEASKGVDEKIQSQEHEPEEQELPEMQTQNSATLDEEELQAYEAPKTDNAIQNDEHDGKSPESKEAFTEEYPDMGHATESAQAVGAIEIADAARMSKTTEAADVSETIEGTKATAVVEADDAAKATELSDMSATAGADEISEVPVTELLDAARASEIGVEHQDKVLEPEESSANIEQTVSADVVPQVGEDVDNPEAAQGPDAMMESQDDEPKEPKDQQLAEMQIQQSAPHVEEELQEFGESETRALTEHDGKSPEPHEAAMKNNHDALQAIESAPAAGTPETVVAALEAFDATKTGEAATAAEASELAEADEAKTHAFTEHDGKSLEPEKAVMKENPDALQAIESVQAAGTPETVVAAIEVPDVTKTGGAASEAEASETVQPDKAEEVVENTAAVEAADVAVAAELLQVSAPAGAAESPKAALSEGEQLATHDVVGTDQDAQDPSEGLQLTTQEAQPRAHEADGAAVASIPPLPSNLSGLHHNTLKAALRVRGLSLEGKKAEHIERLQRWQAAEQSAGVEASTPPVVEEQTAVAPAASPGAAPLADETTPIAPADPAVSQPAPVGIETAAAAEDQSNSTHSKQMKADLETLPIRELRDACRELDLASDGRKVDLVARLVMYADSMMTPNDWNTQSASQGDGHAVAELSPAASANQRTSPAHDATAAEGAEEEHVPTEPSRFHEQPPAAQTTPPAAQSLSPLGAKEAGALVKDLTKLTIPELRKACSEQGLSNKGGKADLVERLTEWAVSQQAIAESPATRATSPAHRPEQVQEAGATPASAVVAASTLTPPVTAGGNTTKEEPTAPRSPSQDATQRLREEVANDLTQRTVPELRKACAEQGLPSKGGKADLVERLADWVLSQQPTADSPASRTTSPANRQGQAQGVAIRNETAEAAPAPPPAKAAPPPGGALATEEDLACFSITDLRSICIAGGLSSLGRKPELVARLVAAGVKAFQVAMLLAEAQTGATESEMPAKCKRRVESPSVDRAEQVRAPDLSEQAATVAASAVQESAVVASQADQQPGPTDGGKPQAEEPSASPSPSEDATQRVKEEVMNDLRSLPLSELRIACLQQGLPSDGTKEILAQRIADFAEQIGYVADDSHPRGEAAREKKAESVPQAEESYPGDAVGGVFAGEDNIESVPQASAGNPVDDDIPESLQDLPLGSLQAACLACGLPADGDATVLAKRLIKFEDEESLPENLGVAELQASEAAVAPSELLPSKPQAPQQAVDTSTGSGGSLQPPKNADVEPKKRAPTKEADVSLKVNPSAAEAHTGEAQITDPVASWSHLDASTDSIPAAQPDPRRHVEDSAESAFPDLQWNPQAVPEPQKPLTAGRAASNHVLRRHETEIHAPKPPASVQHEGESNSLLAGLLLLRTRELRKACEGRGLPTDGSKEDLAVRLVAHGPIATQSGLEDTPTPERHPVSKEQPASAIMSAPEQAPAPVVAPASALGKRPATTALPEEAAKAPGRKAPRLTSAPVPALAEKEPAPVQVQVSAPSTAMANSGSASKHAPSRFSWVMPKDVAEPSTATGLAATEPASTAAAPEEHRDAEQLGTSASNVKQPSSHSLDPVMASDMPARAERVHAEAAKPQQRQDAQRVTVFAPPSSRPSSGLWLAQESRLEVSTGTDNPEPMAKAVPPPVVPAERQDAHQLVQPHGRPDFGIHGSLLKRTRATPAEEQPLQDSKAPGLSALWQTMTVYGGRSKPRAASTAPTIYGAGARARSRSTSLPRHTATLHAPPSPLARSTVSSHMVPVISSTPARGRGRPPSARGSATTPHRPLSSPSRERDAARPMPPSRARSASRSRSRRASAVGTCHGWTAAGAPCQCAGTVRPEKARFKYCGKHAAKWTRFETVGVEQLAPVSTVQPLTGTPRTPSATHIGLLYNQATAQPSTGQKAAQPLGEAAHRPSHTTLLQAAEPTTRERKTASLTPPPQSFSIGPRLYGGGTPVRSGTSTVSHQEPTGGRHRSRSASESASRSQSRPLGTGVHSRERSRTQQVSHGRRATGMSGLAEALHLLPK